MNCCKYLYDVASIRKSILIDTLYYKKRASNNKVFQNERFSWYLKNLLKSIVCVLWTKKAAGIECVDMELSISIDVAVVLINCENN